MLTNRQEKQIARINTKIEKKNSKLSF